MFPIFIFFLNIHIGTDLDTYRDSLAFMCMESMDLVCVSVLEMEFSITEITKGNNREERKFLDKVVYLYIIWNVCCYIGSI